MARKQKTSLIFEDIVIYPSIERESFADEQGFRGLYITVYQKPVNGKKARAIQLELYVNKGNTIGTRIKSKKLEDGKVNGDLPKEISQLYNTIIPQLQLKAYDYVTKKSKLDKEMLMVHLYGKSFLEKYRKKRIKYLTIPIFNNQKIVYGGTGQIIETVNIEHHEAKELIDEFAGKKKLDEIVDDTGSPLVQSMEDYEELLLDLKSQKDSHNSFLVEKKRIESLTVKQRYDEGKWNKENIFELVYSKYWTFKNFWIIKYFFIYRELATPKPHEAITKLDKKWIDDFIGFIRKNGFKREFQLDYISPFKSNIDYWNNCGGQVHKMKDTTLNDFLKHLRQLLRELRDEINIPITEKEIEQLNLEKIGIKFLNQETRSKHSLNKTEFDRLFKAEFKDKVIDKVAPANGKKYTAITYKKEDLAKSRDMFCLMTWLGGMRMIEYNSPTTEILEDENFDGKKKVRFYTSLKNKKPVENPVLSYAEILLKKYKFKIPKFDENINRQIYKSHLREIFKQAGLEREILEEKTYNDETVVVKKKLFEAASPNFSRKTFIQILRQDKKGKHKITRDEIKSFTGHSDKDILDAYSFIDTGHKRSLISHIKPE